MIQHTTYTSLVRDDAWASDGMVPSPHAARGISPEEYRRLREAKIQRMVWQQEHMKRAGRAVDRLSAALQKTLNRSRKPRGRQPRKAAGGIAYQSGSYVRVYLCTQEAADHQGVFRSAIQWLMKNHPQNWRRATAEETVAEARRRVRQALDGFMQQEQMQ